jgi:hypothetical protein
MKSCLHCCLWPLLKNSSQWKHLLSLSLYAISAGERRTTGGEDLAGVATAIPEGAADKDTPCGGTYLAPVRPAPRAVYCGPVSRNARRCS